MWAIVKNSFVLKLNVQWLMVFYCVYCIQLITQDMQKWLLCVCVNTCNVSWSAFSLSAERCSITTGACQTSARPIRPWRSILGISSMWAALARRSGGPPATSAPHPQTALRSESSPAAGGQLQNPPPPPPPLFTYWKSCCVGKNPALTSFLLIISQELRGGRHNLMRFWSAVICF